MEIAIQDWLDYTVALFCCILTCCCFVLLYFDMLLLCVQENCILTYEWNVKHG